jgi:autophagy-related protein 13
MASATTQVKSRWLSEKDQNSLRQMFNNFFTKTAKVIVELRSYSQLNVYGERMTSSDTDVAETDLWFCIGTDVAFARANLISKLYLWTKSDITTLPPLVIETVYDLTQLGPDQELFIDDEPLTRSKTKRKEIVLERWLIRLNLSRFDNDITDIKSLYQRISMLMRCMYTLLGQLPAYRLLLSSDHREHIKTHILDGSQPIRSKGRFGLQKSLTLGKVESDKVQSRTFNPIMTPIGELETSVSYRLNCNFHLETTESSALSVIHMPRNTTASPVKETIDVNTTNTTTIAQTATSTQTAMGISGDHPSSISPTYSNMRYRASSTSINSLTSRRKPSGKGISLFKTGSIASSSPPPAVGPIPVSRNDSTSTSSVHFFNTGSHRVAITPTPGTATSSTTAPVTATTTATATAVATSCSPSQGILITSVSSKYPSSSQGSRYRGNSMDNTPGSNLNPILQSFRFRNKLASSLSDAEVDPTIIGGIGGSSGSPGKAIISGGSLGTGTGTGTGTSTGAGTGTVEDAYGSSFVADDDLSAFMRMLDSKPDLRVSNHSSMFNVNAHGNTSVNEESMMNFRNIRKQNELFAGTGTGVGGGAGETSLRGSIGSASPPPAIGYLHMHTPPTSMALARRTFSSSSMDSASKHLSLPAPAPPPAVSGEPMDSTVRLLQEHGGNRGSVSTSRSRSQSRSSRGSFGVSIGPVDTTTNVVATTLKAAPISETAHVLGTSVPTTTTTTNDSVTATAMTTRGSESGSVGMLRRMSSSAARRPPPRETPHGHAQGHTETSHMKALRALSYGADVFASDGEGEGEGDEDVHEDLLFEMSDVVR